MFYLFSNLALLIKSMKLVSHVILNGISGISVISVKFPPLSKWKPTCYFVPSLVFQTPIVDYKSMMIENNIVFSIDPLRTPQGGGLSGVPFYSH